MAKSWSRSPICSRFGCPRPGSGNALLSWLRRLLSRPRGPHAKAILDKSAYYCNYTSESTPHLVSDAVAVNITPEGADMRILVADDDIFFLKVIEEILTAAGHKVTTVRSGDAVLELVKETEPDLFILDIVMPGLLGTEVSRELRKNTRTARIPILLVSSGAAEFDDSGGDATEYLADDFLQKPFKPEILLDRIKRLASLQSNSQMPPQDTAERRQEPRVPIDVEVTARTAKALMYHPMINISTGGFCLDSDCPLEENSGIELRFVLPYGEGMVSAIGVVAWCLEMDEGVRWVSGIRFTDISPEDVEKIEKYATILLRIVRPSGVIAVYRDEE